MLTAAPGPRSTSPERRGRLLGSIVKTHSAVLDESGHCLDVPVPAPYALCALCVRKRRSAAKLERARAQCSFGAPLN